jgi:aquaporin Z
MTPRPWRPRWREYAIEGWALGTFMLSACAFAALLFHPASPAAAWPLSAVARRWTMGAAMAATLVALVYSPWGRRSGAHMNPAFTVSMLALRRIHPGDAWAYVVAQFVGGWMGVWGAARLLGMALGHPDVNYVVTQPGPAGTGAAFAGEFVVSAMQMTIVLTVAASPRWQRFTGLCAAAALACYIALESPWSGASLNPARTVASALVAGEWTALWLYFAAPVSGMLLAGIMHARRAPSRIPCGKLVHAVPCHFCEHVSAHGSSREPRAA